MHFTGDVSAVVVVLANVLSVLSVSNPLPPVSVTTAARRGNYQTWQQTGRSCSLHIHEQTGPTLHGVLCSD